MGMGQAHILDSQSDELESIETSFPIHVHRERRLCCRQSRLNTGRDTILHPVCSRSTRSTGRHHHFVAVWFWMEQATRALLSLNS